MKQSESLYFKYTNRQGTHHWAKYTFDGDDIIFERSWHAPPYTMTSAFYHRYSLDLTGARELMTSLGWEPCSYDDFIKQRMLSKHG